MQRKPDIFYFPTTGNRKLPKSAGRAISPIASPSEYNAPRIVARNPSGASGAALRRHRIPPSLSLWPTTTTLRPSLQAPYSRRRRSTSTSS